MAESKSDASATRVWIFVDSTGELRRGYHTRVRPTECRDDSRIYTLYTREMYNRKVSSTNPPGSHVWEAIPIPRTDESLESGGVLKCHTVWLSYHVE